MPPLMTSSASHPADGELRSFLDGELTAARALEIRQHAVQCTECGPRLAVIEQDAHTTGWLLDLAVPRPGALELATVVRRARAARRRRVGLLAAAVALFVVSVAGATVGRPYLRALASRLLGLVHTPPPPVRPAVAPPRDSMGIALVPGTEAEIRFDTKQDLGQVQVSLADTAELVIHSDAPVDYRVHAGGVIVHNPGSKASYTIIIPRALPHVRVVVGDRVLLEKIGPRILTGTAADTAPSVVLPLH